MSDQVNQDQKETLSGEYLPAGKIVATHGIRGEFRLLPCCDGPEFILRLKTLYLDGSAIEPSHMRKHKSFLLITLPGIDTIEKAMSLVGKQLFFKKSDVKLPRGVYFFSDLIGLVVYDARTDRVLGKITDILERPANNVFVVTGGENEYLIPEVPEFIMSVDMKKSVMTINSIEGMV